MRFIDVQLMSPFTAVISGPTGSGKTELLVDLIGASEGMANPAPQWIVYCYDVWQTVFEELESRGVRFHHEMINAEELTEEG